jgi:predicted  nucleic acid-binding Zn-ribbon protein
MMEATDRAAQRAARIRALQLTGLQSQRAQLGALEAAAAAAQREIAALEAELRKPPKRSSHLGRAQPGDHADVSHLKQKLEAMSVSDLVELQRCAAVHRCTVGRDAPL